jgi:hypothetical protein
MATPDDKLLSVPLPEDTPAKIVPRLEVVQQRLTRALREVRILRQQLRVSEQARKDRVLERGADDAAT